MLKFKAVTGVVGMLKFKAVADVRRHAEAQGCDCLKSMLLKLQAVAV